MSEVVSLNACSLQTPESDVVTVPRNPNLLPTTLNWLLLHRNLDPRSASTPPTVLYSVQCIRLIFLLIQPMAI